MKHLTAAIILLASFPAYSCPFHSFFLDDEDPLAASKAEVAQLTEEKPAATTAAGPHPLFQFKSFQAQLEQWKAQKSKQQ
ncbi:MAG: hypothetical protein QNJ69_14040 [Gammaproteobacteria bacterium]|nr:hypothetical protein [Gammaproteobacteria bacterium]